MLPAHFNLNKFKKVRLYQVIFLTIFMLGNYWIWKILSYNFLLGVLVLLSCIAIFFSTYEQKLLNLFFLLFIPLIIFQLRLNNVSNVLKLTVSQEITRSQRLPYYTRDGSNIVNRGIRYIFEVRKESAVISNISKNISVIFDPNLYFFANHPRERAGVEEFPKFPFFYIFVFWIGLLELVSKKRNTNIVISLVLSVLFMGVTGSVNVLGPFILFPFIVYILYIGAIVISEQIVRKIKIQ